MSSLGLLTEQWVEGLGAIKAATLQGLCPVCMATQVGEALSQLFPNLGPTRGDMQLGKNFMLDTEVTVLP